MKKNKENEEVYLYFNECDNVKYPFDTDDDHYYTLLRDYSEIVSKSTLKGAL
jgi:hypothetical protein